MDISVTPVDELDSRLADEWHFLANSAKSPNPFLELAFLRPSGAQLPDARGLNLLLGRDGGRLVCGLALAPSARIGKLRTVRGLRNRWPHVFLGQPLIVDGHEKAAAEALVKFLRQSGRSHWLRLQGLDATSDFARAVGESAGRAAVHIEHYSRGFVTRRPDPTYLSGHSNLKRLRRKRRSLEETTGEELQIVDRSADPRAVEEFMALEAAGWKGRDGGAMLCKPWDAVFFRQMCTGFQAAGQLQVWTLQLADRTLAMKMNLVSGDTVFCYLIAFDEDYASVSPGLQLEVENFRLFHSSGYRAMDSCAAPDNGFANRLYPEQRSLVDITIGHGVLGRTVIALGTGLSRESRLRSAPTPSAAANSAARSLRQ